MSSNPDEFALMAGAALARLRALRERIPFLRSLQPDSPAYKLWLGDLVEMANETWGSGSMPMNAIADVLRARGADPAAETATSTAFLQRLDRFDRLLAELERVLP